MAYRILTSFFILLGFAGTGLASDTSSATIDSLDVIIAAGEYERAVVESDSVLTLWEQEFGADSLEAAKMMVKVAQSLNLAGRTAEPRTLELVERAIAIQSEVLGPEHLDTISSQYLHAMIFNTLGRSDEAIEILQQVLAIRTRELGSEHKLTGDVHGVLGRAMANIGRLEDSRNHFERMVAILEAAEGPDAAQLGGGYLNLGTVCQMMGDLPAASAAIQRAIANIELNRGDDHPFVAASRYTLANIHMARGEVRAALAQLERAREILETNDMGGHPWAAAIWNSQGLAARGLGNYVKAQECFERSVEIGEATQGPDHPDLTYQLNNLGLAAQKNGDDVLARESLERSVQLNRDHLGPDNLRTVTSEFYLAAFESEQGNVDLAETQFERCLDILSVELGEDHPTVARLCGDLALIKEQKNLLTEAEVLLDRGLANNGAVVNPAITANLQNIRARVHLRQQDYLASCTEALKVESAAADQYRLVVQTLSEGVSQRFAATRTNGLSVALSALMAAEAPGQLVESAWDQVIRSRGLLLDELTWRRRLVTTTGDPETQRLADEVFYARSRLADMYVRGAGDRSPDIFAADLKSAREDKGLAEAALAVHSASFRSSVQDRGLGLDDIRSALPAGSALVAWQKFQHIGPESEEPWYCVFVLADGEVTVVDLGAASVVDGLIDKWRTGLLEVWSPDKILAGAGVATNREIGAALRDLVWTPFADKLDGAETVFVVPDGDLHLLPLAALPNAADGYLLESGPTFHHLSREKSLVRPSASVGSGLLAFGDPAFDGHVEPSMVAAISSADYSDLKGVLRGTPPDCDRLQSMQFSALPGTRRECEELGTLSSEDTKLLMGAEATEAAFKTSLAGNRIVHLATHGYFVGTDCPAEAAGYADDPLLLAGLALAGANHRTEAESGQEDGIVTAEEISLLDLAGVEWVVLSACDTGLGVVQPGEGVHGLQRAFETAGAGTVVMSLWPVEDQVTQQWMSALYRSHLSEGQATPVAMRQAALEVLEQRRADGLSEHPFWWAGFIAAGDWR